MTDLVERARWIADSVLFPDAAAVDATGVVPESHFRLLAAEGFYGLAASGVELSIAIPVLETLAGGCLSTTFTWMQHHGVVLGLTGSANVALRERYLDDLVAGRLRGGVALAGALADPPRLRAKQVQGGWVLDGDGPFVSGWGIVDLLQLTARAGDTVVNALVDAKAVAGLTAEPYQLVAAQATRTVRLRFDGLYLPDERIVATVAMDEFFDRQVFGSRINACLPIGLALRCADLLESQGKSEAAASIAEQAAQVRADLDAAMPDLAALLPVRATGSALAYRAAGAVVVAEGAAGILVGGHGQRLVREATFTLVAGSRAQIKEALLTELAVRSGS